MTEDLEAENIGFQKERQVKVQSVVTVDSNRWLREIENIGFQKAT